MVHEFAHQFAGLADEYFTAPVTYEAPAQRFEPWEPNATTDPKATKWRDLITPGTPLPTPWPKSEYQAWSKETERRLGQLAASHAPDSDIKVRALRESRDREFWASLNKASYRYSA